VKKSRIKAEQAAEEKRKEEKMAELKKQADKRQRAEAENAYLPSTSVNEGSERVVGKG
jgi:hypothetical protein